MPSLLDQLRSELPNKAEYQQVYYGGDLEKAEEIVRRARELRLATIRYLLKLDRFEPPPPLGSPRRAAYDIMIAGLHEVLPRLEELPGVMVASG